MTPTSNEVMTAAGLMSADETELKTVWKLTRKEAQERATEIMGPEWVAEYLRMNDEQL